MSEWYVWDEDDYGNLGYVRRVESPTAHGAAEQVRSHRPYVVVVRADNTIPFLTPFAVEELPDPPTEED